MSKTMHEILADDLKKNYPEGWMTEDEYVAQFYEISKTASVLRHGDTLFLVHPVDENDCEWHTKNGERGSVLVDNFYWFLKELKALGYKKTFSYFDDEKITHLAKSKKLTDFNISVNWVNEGLFRTWKIEVVL